MPGYRTGYLKMRLREAIDFAITALAYAYKEEDGVIVDARLVAGGIAPVPLRLTAAEQVLVGKKPTPALAEEAFKAAMKDACPMTENSYKLQEVKAQIFQSLGF